MVEVPKDLEAYVAERVASGDFGSEKEVIEHALRLHQQYSRQRDHLRRELQKGIDSAEAGRISNATADEIIAKAKLRMKKTA